MSYEELLELRRHEPFQPFRIHTSDGRGIDVRHPRLLMVLRTLAVIGISHAEKPRPIFDRYEEVPLADITRWEPLAEPLISQAS